MLGFLEHSVWSVVEQQSRARTSPSGRGGCTHSAPSAILIYLSYLWSWTGTKVEGLRIRFVGFMRHAGEIYVLWEKRTVGPPTACGRAVLVRFSQKTYNSASWKTGPPAKLSPLEGLGHGQ